MAVTRQGTVTGNGRSIHIAGNTLFSIRSLQKVLDNWKPDKWLQQHACAMFGEATDIVLVAGEGTYHLRILCKGFIWKRSTNLHHRKYCARSQDTNNVMFMHDAINIDLPRAYRHDYPCDYVLSMIVFLPGTKG